MKEFLLELIAGLPSVFLMLEDFILSNFSYSVYRISSVATSYYLKEYYIELINFVMDFFGMGKRIQ